MSETGVSFLVTVYNKAPYIPLMLRSLAGQEGDFLREFIFIDDGSSDNSLALIQTLTADWPNVTIESQKNAGPAIATNNAARQARFPYLKMVDADDVLAPYATRLLLRAAEKTPCGMVIGDSDLFDDPALINFPAVSHNDPAVEILQDSLMQTIKRSLSGSSDILVEKAVFEAAGGCDERVFSQDFTLALRISRLSPLGYIQEKVCTAPRHIPDRLMNDLARVLRDYNHGLANFLRDNPDLPEPYKRMAVRRALGRAWKWAHREQKAWTGSYYWRLWLWGMLPLPHDHAGLIEKTLGVFRNYSHLNPK